MKITIINNLYAPWTRGGSDKVVERMVAGLEKIGHEVFVITTAPKGSRTEKVYYLRSIFYNLEKYPLIARFFWHIFDLFDLLKVSEVKKILKEKNPDLVITNNLMGLGFLLPGLLKKLKIKHVHVLHDIQLLHPSGLMFWGKEKIIDSVSAKIYQAITRSLFGSPNAVVSPSRWLLDEHEKKGFFKNSKKTILPNYFAEKKLVKNIKQPFGFSQGGKIPDTKYQFLYVGQIEEHKGIEFLIKTFLEFLKNNSGVELMVIGGGSQSEKIKKISAGRPEIKILGRKNSAEVAELMQKSDCLVVPSLCYENSPTVIYEAVAVGLPVIGAKIGGITELIEAAGGILFEPRNQVELLKRMNLLFTHPEESDRIKTKEAAYKPPDYIAELLLM
jgi:glycosyltransferase involved in cell wall biosynthesis